MCCSSALCEARRPQGVAAVLGVDGKLKFAAAERLLGIWQRRAVSVLRYATTMRARSRYHRWPDLVGRCFAVPSARDTSTLL